MGGAVEEGCAAETGAGQAGMTGKPSGTGCMATVLGVNALILGLMAFSMSQGPHYNHEQEIWYRYGSLGFLLSGVILPSIALLLGASRSRAAIIALTAWMIATLIAAVIYGAMSSGRSMRARVCKLHNRQKISGKASYYFCLVVQIPRGYPYTDQQTFFGL